MKTRFLPALAVACSAVVMHAAEPAKPNVLLIIADDLTKALADASIEEREARLHKLLAWSRCRLRTVSMKPFPAIRCRNANTGVS